jgi:DNA-binding response OmpR family regulator
MPNPGYQPLILIVDDDAELASMLVELLVREGWATHTVLTGGDAERALQARQPDLVVLDAMLPDGNGFDLARRWRTTHPALGLVMLTARGDPLGRTVDVQIARLRRKLRDASTGVEWIDTVRGEGYVFVPRGGADGDTGAG